MLSLVRNELDAHEGREILQSRASGAVVAGKELG